MNATVHAMDAKRLRARALAIADGRILVVGTNQQAERFRGKSTKTMDLSEKVVLPGFIDAHTHAMDAGSRGSWVDLGETASLADAVDRLRAHARSTPPGAWIVGWNWNEANWPERRYLARADLDAISADRPILACRIDMHMGTANTAALRSVRLPPDVAGRADGVLKEDAFALVKDATRLDAPTLAAAFPSVQLKLHALGITAVHDMVSPAMVEAYQGVRAAGRLTVRALLNPYVEGLDDLARVGVQTGFGDDLLRLGPLKVFSDGSLGARTAALSEPYADEPSNRGRLVYEPDELRALLAKAHAAGFRLAVHAIGDRAGELVADGLASLEGARDRRHRIEHFELPTADALDAAARAGIVASMQPNFVGDLSHPGGLYEGRLGRGRFEGNNPFREVLGRRIHLAFGSDGMPYGPLFGIASAVNAPFDGQRIAVGDAIAAYTRGSAFAGGQERTMGSLEPGKCADFVVLDGDPFADPRAIASIPVAMTAVGGEIVYRRRGSIPQLE